MRTLVSFNRSILSVWFFFLEDFSRAMLRRLLVDCTVGIFLLLVRIQDVTGGNALFFVLHQFTVNLLYILYSIINILKD